MEENAKIIGGNIKSFRKRMRLNQKDLAKYIGTSREIISYYEAGSRKVPLERLEKLANLFGEDLYDLFEKSDVKQQANVALAFRSDELNTDDLPDIAEFRKIVKNYIKLKELFEKHGY